MKGTAIALDENASLPPTHPNALGVKGWAYAGRYTWERYLYLAHRITGIGLVAYLVFHVVETGIRLQGPQHWASLAKLFSSPVFKFGEVMVACGFAFHALNGFRLLAHELGLLLGKPSHPVYPYPTAVARRRPLTVALMVLTAVLIVLAIFGIYSS
jgi:succinate dehydrogenase / fumarate reductase cytochrome b subunit